MCVSTWPHFHVFMYVFMYSCIFSCIHVYLSFYISAKNKLPTPIRKARKESVKFVNHDFVPSDEETPLSKVMADMPPAAQAAAAKNTTGVYDNLSDRQLHTGTAFFYSFGGKK